MTQKSVSTPRVRHPAMSDSHGSSSWIVDRELREPSCADGKLVVGRMPPGGYCRAGSCPMNPELPHVGLNASAQTLPRPRPPLVTPISSKRLT